MCIRCGEAHAPQPLGLCPACVVQSRVELTDGMRRLAEYLERWAAFEEWMRHRPDAPGLTTS